MGFIADIQAASAVQKIKDGKSMANLSIAQITVLIVNMQDAKKNLSKQKFEEVYAYYEELRKCVRKMPIDLYMYYELSSMIVLGFDSIAPYELYNGGSTFEGRAIVQAARAQYGDRENPFLPKQKISGDRGNNFEERISDAEVFDLISRYAEKSSMSVREYCIYCFEQDMIASGIEKETAASNVKKLADNQPNDFEFAYSLIMRYAEKSEMTVQEYLAFCKSEESKHR